MSKMASEPAAERAFRMVEAAAEAGMRCPINTALPGGGLSLRHLVSAGRIKVEIGRHNYRVAVVLSGPHSGASTRRPADGMPWRPYLVADKKGARRLRYNPPVAPAAATRPQSGVSSPKTAVRLRAPGIVAAALRETGHLAGALRELRHGMLATALAPPPRRMGFPGPGRCVWPIGDPREPDFAFCDERADAGPYCARHRKKAYQPLHDLSGASPSLTGNRTNGRLS